VLSLGQACEDIIEDIGKLGDDELRVAAWVIKRLLIGKEKYGGLKLATDNRGHSNVGWGHEATEEILDAFVYLGCRAVQALDKEKDNGK
jgi:hypothetical protein